MLVQSAIDRGMKVDDAAAVFQVGRSTINHWLKIRREPGWAELQVKKAPGRTPKLSDRQMAQLRGWSSVRIRGGFSSSSGCGRRLKLFYLPPYSPELNPDEWIWKCVKHDHAGRMAVRSVQQLKDGITRAVSRLQEMPHLVRNILRNKDLLYVTT